MRRALIVIAALAALLANSPASAQAPTIMTAAGGAVPPVPTSGIGSVDGVVVVSRGGGVVSTFYVSNQTNRLYELRNSNGVTSLQAVAGTGFAGFNGVSGALSTTFNAPSALIQGSSGLSLLIADTANNRVRLYDEQAGSVTPWFGSGVCTPGTLPQSGVAPLSANLCRPTSMTGDGQGVVYVIDSVNQALWKVDPSANMAHVLYVDPQFTAAARLAVAPHPTSFGEALVLVSLPGSILQLDTARPRLMRLLATGSRSLPAVPASYEPKAHALYYVDVVKGATVLQRLELTKLTTMVVAGLGVNGPPYAVPPSQSRFVDAITALSPGGLTNSVSSMAVGQPGYLHAYMSKQLSTFGGDGTVSHCGDTGPAVDACLNQPLAVTTAANGSFIVADAGNARLRVIDSLGGMQSYQVRLNPANPAELPKTPAGVAYDTDTGAWYVSSAEAHQVYRLAAPGMPAQIVAGTGEPGYTGDHSQADDAELNRPMGLVFVSRPRDDRPWQRDRFLYVADAGNHSIRRIDLDTGIITTVVGTGDPFTQPFDGYPGTDTSLNEPVALSYARHCLHFAERSGHRVRRICSTSPVSGGEIVEPVAGTGAPGLDADGGLAVFARLSFPSGVAEALDGRVFVADAGNLRVRVVDGAVMTTVAGGGNHPGNGMVATSTAFGTNVQTAFDPSHSLGGLAFVRAGTDDRLFIADKANHRIRIVCACPTTGPAPDLTISKAIEHGGTRVSALQVHAGDTVQFVITVGNVGLGATTGPATVTDTLDPRFTILSASNGCVWSGQIVSCQVGPLAGANSVDIMLTVRVSGAVDVWTCDGLQSLGYCRDDIENRASVLVGGDVNGSNDQSAPVTVHVLPPPPEMHVQMTFANGQSTILVANGDLVTLVGTVENSGGPIQPAAYVQLDILAPPRLTFVGCASTPATFCGPVTADYIEWLWFAPIGEAGGPRTVSFQLVARVSPTAAPAGQIVQIAIDAVGSTLGKVDTSSPATATLLVTGQAP